MSTPRPREVKELSAHMQMVESLSNTCSFHRNSCCIGGMIISKGNKILLETIKLCVLGVFSATKSALRSRWFPQAPHGELDDLSMWTEESQNRDPRSYLGPVNMFQRSIALALHSFQTFSPTKALLSYFFAPLQINRNKIFRQGKNCSPYYSG